MTWKEFKDHIDGQLLEEDLSEEVVIESINIGQFDLLNGSIDISVNLDGSIYIY